MTENDTATGSAADPGRPTDEVLAALPAKVRVHALARLVGSSSREVLAVLARMDVGARSAQSSVDRETVARVVDDLFPGQGAALAALPPTSADEAAGTEVATAAVTTPAASPARVAPAPMFLAPGSEGGPAAPDEAAPDEAAPSRTGDPEAEPAAGGRTRRRRSSRSSGVVTPTDGAAATPDATDPARPADPSDPDTSDAPVEESPADAASGGGRSGRGSRRGRGRRGAAAADDGSGPDEADENPTDTTEGSVTAGPSDASDPGEDDDDDDDGARRRRRRGRRGRGRGRGPADESSSDDDSDEDEGATGSSDDDEDSSSDDTSGDDSDDEQASAGGSRRRRRRRRRGSDADGSDSGGSDAGDGEDPPHTVTHVREKDRERSEDEGGGGRTRKLSSNDEVRGVKGSTRLEAKRQRRRDGRDAGRRRPPILSESEFLARREAVERTMVVRQQSDRSQIGVLEDDVLVEHFVAGHGQNSMVGNVYLGRVQNVLPSMEAAFVDIGRGRNAVLYAGEVNWDASGLEGRQRKIEQALSSGDSVLVQVTKDPVGHKGARLTTQISLPGRFLVYVPGGGATGISRKLPDPERKRLKEILKRIVPDESGVIIRTAAEGVDEDDLERDVRRLKAQWEAIESTAAGSSAKSSKAPTLVHEEPDLLIRVVRDMFNEDFASLVISGEQAWETLSGYIGQVAPELAGRLERHVGPQDVFAAHRIDEQLIKALDRKVWLPSGGTLVIDRTEAMTVVDVNTGKFTGSGGNLEETVTRNNLEAAEEIVRQLRLRDIGGMIVVDFIDMVLESNRDLVLRRLTECLGRDRTRHQVSEVTSLGLVQMTRKRVGQGLLDEFSTTCEHCKGRGVLVHTEPVFETGKGNGNGSGRGHGSGSGNGSGQATASGAEQGNGSGGQGRRSGAGGSGHGGPAVVAAAMNPGSTATEPAPTGSVTVSATGTGDPDADDAPESTSGAGDGAGASGSGGGRRRRGRRSARSEGGTPSTSGGAVATAAPPGIPATEPEVAATDAAEAPEVALEADQAEASTGAPEADAPSTTDAPAPDPMPGDDPIGTGDRADAAPTVDAEPDADLAAAVEDAEVADTAAAEAETAAAEDAATEVEPGEPAGSEPVESEVALEADLADASAGEAPDGNAAAPSLAGAPDATPADATPAGTAPEPADDGHGGPVRRPRRRAASRPAGPPPGRAAGGS